MCVKNVLHRTQFRKTLLNIFKQYNGYQRLYYRHFSQKETKLFWTSESYIQKYIDNQTVGCFAWPRSFSTSLVLYKRRKTREEKKLGGANIIQYRPKSKNPVVELWNGITPKEIAKQIQCDLDSVYEALSYVENGHYFQDADAKIYNDAFLREIASKLGFRVQMISNPNIIAEQKIKKVNDLEKRPPPNPKDLVKRPPVVTIMGHVDHGKTTLLDTLRNTSVAAQEFGGITQHIGAFTFKTPNGDITFLDTPGHAAFQAMRSRGAHVTDIVVLVVAADDGVMEQTVESLRFAREANVPIIIAINKIDKNNVDIDRVKQDLLKYGVQLEESGGDVQSVAISAKKNLHLDTLIDAILLQAEIMEIRGDPTGPVEGVVLETSIDTWKGKKSTALIQRGTLKKGMFLVAGTAWGKVKAMVDDQGKNMIQVTPGLPVQVLGWKELPAAGDIILEATSEKHCRSVIAYRESLKEEAKLEEDKLAIQKKLEEHLKKYQAQREERFLAGRYRKLRVEYAKEKEIIIDDTPFLAMVLKGDVHGSVEAIIDVLSTYNSHKDCRLDLVHCAVGDVTETDIFLAESYMGQIYCFNVNISPALKSVAEEKNVPVKCFKVIYHLIDDVKTELTSRLPLVRDEDVLGEANVLQEFIISEGKKKIHVAGCKCVQGIIKKSFCKVIRSGKVMYDGKITSLKHEKNDVESIKTSTECGLSVENSSFSFLPGDTIICYDEKQVQQKMNWDPGF